MIRKALQKLLCGLMLSLLWPPVVAISQVRSTGERSVAIGVVNGNVTFVGRGGPSDAAINRMVDLLNVIKAHGGLSNDELARIVDRINNDFLPEIESVKEDTTILRQQVGILVAQLGKAAKDPPSARAELAPLLAPSSMQYLYGSGEAAALSKQAYNALVDVVRFRLQGEKADPTRARMSAVLRADATLTHPMTVDCGSRPPAVIFDIDETLLLNLGFEFDQALNHSTPSAMSWDVWERMGVDKVTAAPGAVDALGELRRMGVAVIFITNRSAENVQFTIATLEHAGLGRAVRGDTLYVRGDAGGGSGKDRRRAAATVRYCVMAMAGDQLTDFSDLFNSPGSPLTRRQWVQSPQLSAFWGRQWFVLPNPVYGASLRGDRDEIFPADKRWTSPAVANDK